MFVSLLDQSLLFFFKDDVLDWAGLEWDGVGWYRRVRTSDVDFNRLDNYCTDVDIEIEVW